MISQNEARTLKQDILKWAKENNYPVRNKVIKKGYPKKKSQIQLSKEKAVKYYLAINS